ncbi:MAG: dihydropteroate synthase [Kiritimatiellaeota bacterium]|nr:dihydropteroate synthase [Kiritimatiellota bacterium]
MTATFPLTIIGERINDSIPATHDLYERGDLDGIVALARAQADGGAKYIDVNIGRRAPELMAETVRRIQSAVACPLSIDTPDHAAAKAGLEALAPDAPMPILNSISPLRMEMLGLYAVRPFRPILLISESVHGGAAVPCRTAEETCAAARLLLAAAQHAGIPIGDCIFDPGIAPLATDTEGNLRRLMGALRMMREDPAFSGAHASVGLSNFTVMLPPKRADGSPVKAPLESAFLTRAMPLGLDHIVGSVTRGYRQLPEGHPALCCFDDCLAADGYDSLFRVQAFYA